MHYQNSEIAEFFNGRSVFVTGGTGYVGKAVIEKLLRGCCSVENVYVLVRDKRGTSANHRLEKLLSDPLFTSVRSTQPDALSKVKPILGDITLSGLGIGQSDLKLLRETVSVIIHSAANVKFDEDIRVAMNINVAGTSRVVEMAKSMKLLKAMVYVSTAFSNCERTLIEEKVYPVNIDPQGAIEQCKNLCDQNVKAELPRLLGQKPNAYTLTKHLAEEVINQAHKHTSVPVCIVRPSIVAAAYTEPIPGYVDNYNGASGLLVGVLTGAIHTLLLNDEYKIDIIPLDYTTNAILAAAWKLGRNGRGSDLQVYNLTSYKNPFVIPKILHSAKKSFFGRPFKNIVWYPTLYVTSSYPVFRVMNFLVHKLPAHLLDTVAGLRGGKQRLVPIYNKLSNNFGIVRYFCTRKWEFRTENIVGLYNALSPADQSNFPFEATDIDWDNYIYTYIQGLRKYTLKDEGDLDEAKRQVQKFQMLHRLLTLLPLLPLFIAIVVMVTAFRNI